MKQLRSEYPFNGEASELAKRTVVAAAARSDDVKQGLSLLRGGVPHDAPNGELGDFAVEDEASATAAGASMKSAAGGSSEAPEDGGKPVVESPKWPGSAAGRGSPPPWLSAPSLAGASGASTSQGPTGGPESGLLVPGGYSAESGGQRTRLTQELA